MLAVDIHQQVAKFLQGADRDWPPVDKTAGRLVLEYQAAQRTFAGFVT